MNRPATIYARAAAPVPMGPPAQVWRFDPTKVDGRWTKVLRACCHVPMTVGDINRLVRKYGPDRTSRTEKARTWRAVSNLIRLGLLSHGDGRYLASGAGLRALAEVREAA